MSGHKTRAPHVPTHGSGCGHTALKHKLHVDYLHDSHLHRPYHSHSDSHGAVSIV